MKLGSPYSLSVLFWFFIGIIRFLSEEIFAKPKRVKRAKIAEKISKVAVCIPAHNEEVIISKTIKSVKRLLPAKQIYVVSDGSTDRTAKIAREQRCHVLKLMPGEGKARALVALFKHFNLLKRYDFILFVDADTIIDKNYLKRALPIFESDPRVAAITAYAVPSWRKQKRLTKKGFISAYRTKLYRILQLFLMYGQTWKYTNVNPVIPGFASFYRTRVLKQLRLDTPGIWIEDFNLAFQIHKKRLGRIAHHPSIFATYQDPSNFVDYWKQVRRWNIGFFQTVRKHGIWPSFFWVSLGFFTVEVLVFSIFTIILPILALLLTTQYYAPIINPEIVRVSGFVSNNYITLLQILVVFFLVDYTQTLFVAIWDKKYSLILYGLGFLFFQYLNALILILSLPKGLLTKSKGRWTPARRS